MNVSVEDKSCHDACDANDAQEVVKTSCRLSCFVCVCQYFAQCHAQQEIDQADGWPEVEKVETLLLVFAGYQSKANEIGNHDSRDGPSVLDDSAEQGKEQPSQQEVGQEPTDGIAADVDGALRYPGLHQEKGR